MVNVNFMTIVWTLDFVFTDIWFAHVLFCFFCCCFFTKTGFKLSLILTNTLKTYFLRLDLKVWYSNIILMFCFLGGFSQRIQSDLLQFGACNIHSWSIDCYSSGNYLKRESSCAFLMDCACLPLLYMDRELVWRSVILFSQSFPSALLFVGKNISCLHSIFFKCF